jgi:hypothetical protein
MATQTPGDGLMGAGCQRQPDPIRQQNVAQLRFSPLFPENYLQLKCAKVQSGLVAHFPSKTHKELDLT